MAKVDPPDFNSSKSAQWAYFRRIAQLSDLKVGWTPVATAIGMLLEVASVAAWGPDAQRDETLQGNVLKKMRETTMVNDDGMMLVCRALTALGHHVNDFKAAEKKAKTRQNNAENFRALSLEKRAQAIQRLLRSLKSEQAVASQLGVRIEEVRQNRAPPRDTADSVQVSRVHASRSKTTR